MVGPQSRARLKNRHGALGGDGMLKSNVVPRVFGILLSTGLLIGCGGAKISSHPSGAAAYLNGQLCGRTPCAGSAVAPYPKVYKVVLDGYEIDSVRWRSGGLAMDFRLKPIGGTPSAAPETGESGGGL
jgi:hypothetical protein